MCHDLSADRAARPESHLIRLVGNALNRLTRKATTWLSGRSRPVRRAGWIRRPAFTDASGRRSCKYCLYVPAGLTATDAVPLLVMLHGCSQDGATLAAGTRMNALADLQRFIVLYPEQSLRANPLRCWRWFSRDTLDGAGDAVLIATLVRRIVSRYPIDASRVYVAGISAGGAMAAVLACCYGRLFAACAIASGMMYRAAESLRDAAAVMQQGSRAAPDLVARAAALSPSGNVAFVPALVIHGDEDSTVHPRNAGQIIEQLRAFARYAGGVADPLTESPEVRVTEARRAYRQQDYLQNKRIVLRKIIVEGMGHAWSGGDERHPFNDAAGPDASRLIWDFVSMFRRA
jgi:poly(hydroxyalkanoate) depolymerase family esterase